MTSISSREICVAVASSFITAAILLSYQCNTNVDTIKNVDDHDGAESRENKVEQMESIDCENINDNDSFHDSSVPMFLGDVSSASRHKSGIIKIMGDEESFRPTSIIDLEPTNSEAFNLFVGVKDEAAENFHEMHEKIFEGVTSIQQSLSILKRSRAVTILANKLMMAEDEKKCFEEVSKLLVALFEVERSSYTLMIDDDHFTIVTCSVTKADFATNVEETYLKCAIKGTAIGHCADTLEVLYTPCAHKVSKFTDHIDLSKKGLKSFINVPILIGDRQFAGCLNIGSIEEDPFTPFDIILIEDVAKVLGTHVYAKRLQHSKTESHRLSQKLLHSFIPPSVIEKIEHYWHCPSRRRSSPSCAVIAQSIKFDQDKIKERKKSKRNLGILSDVANEIFFGESGNLDSSLDISVSNEDLTASTAVMKTALYAEEAKCVSIIFSDIVGFSKIALKLPPVQVMDMLQDLFSRFDMLCKKYGIFKLETIGDAYLCSAGLFEDNSADNGEDAAIRILSMAKEMIITANQVPIPESSSSFGGDEFLKIRVGIHVGDLMYGVLGQTIPKLICIGNSVNLAARMEQTCSQNKIHVTDDFHDIIGDDENGWEPCRRVKVKNMGEVTTWMLDPYKRL